MIHTYIHTFSPAQPGPAHPPAVQSGTQTKPPYGARKPEFRATPIAPLPAPADEKKDFIVTVRARSTRAAPGCQPGDCLPAPTCLIRCFVQNTTRDQKRVPPPPLLVISTYLVLLQCTYSFFMYVCVSWGRGGGHVRSMVPVNRLHSVASRGGRESRSDCPRSPISKDQLEISCSSRR